MWCTQDSKPSLSGCRPCTLSHRCNRNHHVTPPIPELWDSQDSTLSHQVGEKKRPVLWDFWSSELPFMAGIRGPPFLPFTSFPGPNLQPTSIFPRNNDHSYLVAQPWCPVQAQNLGEWAVVLLCLGPGRGVNRAETQTSPLTLLCTLGLVCDAGKMGF